MDELLEQMKIIVDAQLRKIRSEMGREVDTIKEEEFLRTIPEMAMESDERIRSFAKIIAHSKATGASEALLFILGKLKKLVRDSK